MLTKTRTCKLVAALPIVVALAFPLASADAASVKRPPRAPSLMKPDQHAKRGARPAGRPRARVLGRASSVVATVGGPEGNFTHYEYRGCTQYPASGLSWSRCRFDWFFGGSEAQFTTWDYYWYSGGWRHSGTYRCNWPTLGGGCFWL
jgi:hypothetical protein